MSGPSGPVAPGVTCFKCRVHVGSGHGATCFLWRDSDRLVPLCPRCAIQACFRIGATGRLGGAS